MKKLPLDKKTRMDAIRRLNIDLKAVSNYEEASNIAESIEILCNTKLLKQLNAAIDDVKAGRFTILKNSQSSVNNKGGKNDRTNI